MDVTNSHSDFANFESFSNFNENTTEEKFSFETKNDNQDIENNWATDFEQADFQTFESEGFQAFDCGDDFQSFENSNQKTDEPVNTFKNSGFQGFEDVSKTQYEISKELLKNNFGQTNEVLIEKSSDVESLVTR